MNTNCDALSLCKEKKFAVMQLWISTERLWHNLLDNKYGFRPYVGEVFFSIPIVVDATQIVVKNSLFNESLYCSDLRLGAVHSGPAYNITHTSALVFCTKIAREKHDPDAKCQSCIRNGNWPLLEIVVSERLIALQEMTQVTKYLFVLTGQPFKFAQTIRPLQSTFEKTWSFS